VVLAVVLLVYFFGSQHTGVLAAESTMTEPIDVGTERQLFLSGHLIASKESVSLRLHHPVRREAVMGLNDEPWEGRRTGGYICIIQDADRLRMYYPCREVYKKGEQYMGYAESKDGIRWTKPELGIIEYEGSKRNNLVLKKGMFGDKLRGIGGKPFHEGGMYVMRDPRADVLPGQRYKATLELLSKPVDGIVGLVSPDGLHWQPIQQAPLLVAPDDPLSKTRLFDTLNVLLWDPRIRRYVLYLRGSKIVGNGYLRSIRRSVSDDFLNWSRPEYLDIDEQDVHLYTSSASVYQRAPHTTIMFPNRLSSGAWHAGSGKVVDIVFMSTRDGVHVDWPFRSAFIRPGLDPRDWGYVEGGIWSIAGAFQTSPEELSLYVSANTTTDTRHVRRYTVRTDGFMSMSARDGSGSFLTKPLRHDGSELEINYSTSAAGYVRIYVIDPRGRETLQSEKMMGDDISRIVPWANGGTFAACRGTPVLLRFSLKDADLYSFRCLSEG